MALYPFEDVETGEYVELEFPMLEAPGFGAEVERDGRTLRRLVTAPKVLAVVGVTRGADRHFTSNSLPWYDPDAPRHEPGTGKAQFANQKEVREYLAKKKDREGQTDIIYEDRNGPLGRPTRKTKK